MSPSSYTVFVYIKYNVVSFYFFLIWSPDTHTYCNFQTRTIIVIIVVMMCPCDIKVYSYNVKKKKTRSSALRGNATDPVNYTRRTDVVRSFPTIIIYDRLPIKEKKNLIKFYAERHVLS